MLVYRTACYNEVSAILKDKTFIGSYFKIDESHNTHIYDINEKYLHFFKNIENFMYLDYENKYLCRYEIDDELLKEYEGKGFYLNIFFSRERVSVIEYAIPAKLLNFSNLVSVEYISMDIDPEELSMDTIEEALVLKYKKC